MGNQITTLGKISKIYAGGTPSRNEPKYWGGDIPWVKTTQVQNGIITLNDVDEHITIHGLKSSSAKIVPKGSILMAMIGQGKTRGQVAMLAITAAINQNAAAIVLDDTADRDFVFQQLLYRYEDIRKLSNSGGQQSLNLELVRSIIFPFPKIEEQKAIANILFTWDEAITKIERLIELREKHFRYLITQIFNNPEMSWNFTKLNKLVRVKKGEQLNRTELEKEGVYPAWNGGITPSGYTDKWNTEKNTVTISEGGNSCGFVNYSRKKFWCGGHCYSLMNVSDKISAEFLYFYLKTHEKQIMSLRVGSGLPNIQKGDIEKFEISYPNLEEQKAISHKLNTVQSEIMLIRQLSNLYRQQKRGLMQKLLTGKWKVNFKEEK